MITFAALLWSCSNRSMSFLCWGIQSWTQNSSWGLIWTVQKGRITSLDLLATFLLAQPKIWLSFWAVSTHCRLMSSFSSTSTHSSFLAGLLSIFSSLSLYWRQRVAPAMWEWFKTVLGRFGLDIQKHLFTKTMVNHWNRLSREVVNSPSLSVFKRHLDNALNTL